MNSRTETLRRAIAGLRAKQEEITAEAERAEAGTPAPSAPRRKRSKKERAA